MGRNEDGIYEVKDIKEEILKYFNSPEQQEEHRKAEEDRTKKRLWLWERGLLPNDRPWRTAEHLYRGD